MTSMAKCFPSAAKYIRRTECSNSDDFLHAQEKPSSRKCIISGGLNLSARSFRTEVHQQKGGASAVHILGEGKG